jgi:hydrocephalus-inducing protein
MGKQKEKVYNLEVDADVVGTKLLFSKREIRFIQLNDEKAHLDKSFTQLTCQNVYVKPLHMKFLVKPPFGCNKDEATLAPIECLTLDLSFEWQNPTIKKSMVFIDKFEVVYTDTMYRDTLDMVGEVHFPNLRLSTNQLNFEAVIEHTCKRLQMTIKNPSAMQVSYTWSFFEHDPHKDIKVSLEARKKSKGLKIPLNEIFDLLPIRATLDPGEHEIVEASFYAYPGYVVHAIAICRGVLDLFLLWDNTSIL